MNGVLGFGKSTVTLFLSRAATWNRLQAYYILNDPYANAFRPAWTSTARLNRGQRLRGTGGWVWDNA